MFRFLIRHWWKWIGFLLVAWWPYRLTFTYPFHFDDYTLFEKPIVTDLAHHLREINVTGERSVGYFTFGLNYTWHQKEVWGYHAVNWLIHLINGLLVGQLLLTMFELPHFKRSVLYTERNSISWLAALIFLSHPLQIQAVTYIVQRIASLATLWYLLSLWAFLQGTLRGHKGWWFCLALVAAVLSMYTKAIGITLPLMAVWIMTVGYGRQVRVLSRVIIPGLLVIVIAAGIFFWFANPRDYMFAPKITNLNETVTSYTYALTQTRVIPTYVRLFLLPVGQNVDYYFPLSTSWKDGRVLAGFFILIMMMYGLWRSLKRWPLISLGLGWFFIGMMVESSIMPIADVIFEHRMYLPLVGLAAVTSGALFGLLQTSPGDARIIGGFIVAALMVLTNFRNQVWESEYRLWGDVLKKSPQIGRVHNLYGAQLFLGRHYQEALYHFKEAIRLNPHIDGAYSNAGHAAMELKQYQEAIALYEQALVVNHHLPVDVATYLQTAYEKVGQATESGAKVKSSYQSQ